MNLTFRKSYSFKAIKATPAANLEMVVQTPYLLPVQPSSPSSTKRKSNFFLACVADGESESAEKRFEAEVDVTKIQEAKDYLFEFQTKRNFSDTIDGVNPTRSAEIKISTENSAIELFMGFEISIDDKVRWHLRFIDGKADAKIKFEDRDLRMIVLRIENIVTNTI